MKLHSLATVLCRIIFIYLFSKHPNMRSITLCGRFAQNLYDTSTLVIVDWVRYFRVRIKLFGLPVNSNSYIFPNTFIETRSRFSPTRRVLVGYANTNILRTEIILIFFSNHGFHQGIFFPISRGGAGI